MMKVQTIADELKLTPFSNETGLDGNVSGAYTSDLLSDVMARVKAGNIWITLQTHKNVMAVASLRDLAAIVLVNNLKPDPDMLEQAIVEGIPVLGTAKSAFEISGELYKLLEKIK